MIKLYDYQQRYLQNFPKRGIMAAATGTGKTFMSLAHYEKHCSVQDSKGNRTYLKPLLVLAPASKVRTGDWERDIALFFGENNQPEYSVYSYEKFSRNPTLRQFAEGKRAIWHKYSPKHGGKQHAVIADECHRHKNSQSGIGKAIYHCVKGADFYVGLSATPMPNGWIDFANYSKIFGFTKHITEFRKKYCNIQTYKGFPEIVGYWHENKLKEQWVSISRRLTKEQADDLPERVFVGVNFQKPKEYNIILTTRIWKGEMLDTAGKLAHTLRQSLTKPKLKYLEDLLLDTDDNIVIFYNYISERKKILDLLKNKKFKDKTIFRLDGSKHELPSKEEWKDIHNSVTLSHYKSGATGVEMTYASQVVYFSPTYSFAEYLQSIGRVHRNGQEKKTTFYNFRTRNTIETKVYDVLNSKNDFQAKQWYKEEFDND